MKQTVEQAREWALRERISELESELAQAYSALVRIRACPCAQAAHHE